MSAFPTTAPVTVVLDVSAGNIHITSGDRAEAVVEVTPTDPNRKYDVTAAEEATVEFVNGELRINARQPNMSIRARSVNVTIQVPTDSKVRGELAVGRFQTEGKLDAVKFSVASGGLTLDRVGAATLKMSQGDILVGQVNASASIETSDGNVRVIEVVRGKVDVTTQRGNIEVGVHPAAGAQLTTQTMVGKVSNSLSANPGGQPITENVTLNLKAAAGDLAVHRSTETA